MSLNLTLKGPGKSWNLRCQNVYEPCIGLLALMAHLGIYILFQYRKTFFQNTYGVYDIYLDGVALIHSISDARNSVGVHLCCLSVIKLFYAFIIKTLSVVDDQLLINDIV